MPSTIVYVKAGSIMTGAGTWFFTTRMEDAPNSSFAIMINDFGDYADLTFSFSPVTLPAGTVYTGCRAIFYVTQSIDWMFTMTRDVGLFWENTVVDPDEPGRDTMTSPTEFDPSDEQILIDGLFVSMEFIAITPGTLEQVAIDAIALEVFYEPGGNRRRRWNRRTHPKHS